MDSKETYSPGLFAPSPPSATCDDDNESLGLSSARASFPSGFTVDSYIPHFHLQQLSKTGSLVSPQPAPSPPMSLRARESSAMALKYIYEQKINNNALSREQRHPMGGLQTMRNQSMPDLRKRNIPDLDLTFKKSDDCNLPHVQKGFGSPISTPTSQSSLPTMSGQLGHHQCMPQAAALNRLNPSSRQSTAQMTVFYAGNVNVFDDVPADKAHAIMLLAGNSWSSSSFKCPAPPVAAAPLSPPVETVIMRERAPSPIKAIPSQLTSMTSTIDRGGAMAKSYGSPGPVTASLASPPPSPALQAPSPVADSAKSSQAAGAAVKRPHAGIELPHARKASLARFLEKRKDRVQVQQDQQGGAAFEKGGGEPTSGHDTPDHAATSSSSKKRSRSRSPSPARSIDKEKNAKNNNAVVENPSMNERRFFH